MSGAPENNGLFVCNMTLSKLPNECHSVYWFDDFIETRMEDWLTFAERYVDISPKAVAFNNALACATLLGKKVQNEFHHGCLSYDKAELIKLCTQESFGEFCKQIFED